MAIHTWFLIAVLLPHSTWAGPLLSTLSLSPQLTSLIPACAHGCLRSFLADNFPSPICRGQSNIECLCTRDSKTGLTLGEGALRCLASGCATNSTAINQAIAVYEVCQKIPGAKHMTHQTLTATQVVVTTVHSLSPAPTTMSEENPEPSPALPTTIPRPPLVSISQITDDAPFPTGLITDTSILSVPSVTALDNPATTSNFLPPVPTTFTSPTSPTSTSQGSAIPTALPAATPQPALTKPQIAGVAVGSIAAAGLVFGLLALIFCLRDRKSQRRGSDASFGNDKIVIDQPRTPSPPPPPAPAFQDVEYGHREVGVGQSLHTQAMIARPQSNRWSFWRKSVKPEEIGVAVARNQGAQITREHSPITPMSAASYETTSRLLPDKPTYSLYPKSLRLSTQHQTVSPVDPPEPAVVRSERALPGLVPRPAPRGRGTMDTSQANLHVGQPTLRAVPSDPFLDSSSSNRQPDPRQFQTLPAQRNRLGHTKPVSVHYGQWAEPIEVHRKPVPARLLPVSPRGDSSIERLDWGLDAPLQTKTPPLNLPIVLSQPQPARRKSSGKRKPSGKRPITSFSNTSGTTIEDASSDEDEPPLPPAKTLTPLLESPRSGPRAAGVRYPVIPASAAGSPSINRTVLEVPRMQMELNPASDRSQAKSKLSPKFPSSRDRTPPNVPELGGRELRERQQAPEPSPKPGSAKWSILVAPGLEGIENVSTPRSKTSMEWTPASTPTRARR